MALACSVNVAVHERLATSHNCTVSSKPPLASVRLSGENAKQLTGH
jgi:hypothetical protein